MYTFFFTLNLLKIKAKTYVFAKMILFIHSFINKYVQNFKYVSDSVLSNGCNTPKTDIGPAFR